MSARRTLIASSAALFLAAGSCRHVDVCGATCSDDMTTAGEGGVASGGKPGVSTSGDAATLAGGGAGGDSSEAGAKGESGAGGEPSTEPLQCDAGKADCDYSRLTGCETEIDWTVRHCGGCGISCADGCSVGKCLQSALVASDAMILGFVSTKTFAFAALSNMDSTRSLQRIDVGTGASTEILTGLRDEAKLALGDRLYLLDADVLDSEPPELRSMALDGTDPKLEDVTHPWELEAYSGGTYYVGEVTDSKDNTTYPLYYRPAAANAWQVLKAHAPGSLVSSSAHGVVYTETDADDVEQIYVLKENQIIPYGPTPPNTTHVLATSDGVAVLTYSYDESTTELWWLTTDSAPTHYALPYSISTPRMRPYRQKVAVSLIEGKSAYVEVFGPSGSDMIKIGVRLGSELQSLDDHYLWHLVTDDWFHWRFLRTEWELFGF
jgi:hypothetical protein